MAMKTTLAIMTFLTLGTFGVGAQDHAPAGAVDPRLPALVWAAYPELRTEPLQWRETAPGVVTVAILEAPSVDGLPTAAPDDPRATSAPREPVLVTTLELDAAGLVRWTVRGPATRDTARAALASMRTTNPAAVADALREAGARYGAEASDVERALPLAALQRILGPLTVGTITFDDDATPLHWRLELRGAGVTYRATVEPFDGRLTSIVRDGGAQ
jgi:hypothetical protein